jgi:hypothetical protein
VCVAYPWRTCFYCRPRLLGFFWGYSVHIPSCFCEMTICLTPSRLSGRLSAGHFWCLVCWECCKVGGANKNTSATSNMKPVGGCNKRQRSDFCGQISEHLAAPAERRDAASSSIKCIAGRWRGTGPISFCADRWSQRTRSDQNRFRAQADCYSRRMRQCTVPVQYCTHCTYSNTNGSLGGNASAFVALPIHLFPSSFAAISQNENISGKAAGSNLASKCEPCTPSSVCMYLSTYVHTVQ